MLYPETFSFPQRVGFSLNNRYLRNCVTKYIAISRDALWFLGDISK